MQELSAYQLLLALTTFLKRGNSNGGVDVGPESGIDAIVSHVLEEPGQHILRVEVGYGSPEGQKTLRKFYRFQVSVPLILCASTFKIDESTCFVSLDVQNNRTETKGKFPILYAGAIPIILITVQIRWNDYLFSRL